MNCKDCNFWVFDKYNNAHQCTNPKIEDGFDFKDQVADGLQYEYLEGGSFFPGPMFGCVHFETGKLYEGTVEAIRAEALKDAADRAISWVHGFGVELLYYDDHGNDLDCDIGLRNAIYAGDAKE